MATVSATFAVAGSTYREIKMDTDGMAVDEIADALEQQVDDPSFCHQCSSECEDPALEEMTSVAVDGVEYVYGETGWRRTDEPRPAPNPLRKLQEALAGFRAPELPAEVREAFEVFCRRVNETMRAPRS